MAYATKKQLEYAEQISNSLGISLPESKDFYSINKFIADNRQEFYKTKDRETRELICSNISIVSIASEMGFTPVRVGRYYTLKEHDSVRIDTYKNCYWRNSVGYGYGRSSQGGSVIDFVHNFTGKSVGEVIKELSERVSGNNYQATTNYQRSSIPKEHGTLELPPKASNMRRAYAYLITTRGLEQSIVQEFVNNKMLYQDDHGNCVFVSRDKEENPVFACKRGTSTEKRFMGDVANSDYTKGFYIDNNASKLIVSESVIDAMSIMGVIEAKGMDYHEFNHMPLAGAYKFESIINQLKEHPVTDIYLALDNDEAGISNMEKIKELIAEELPEADMWIHECLPEYTKDWNEEIKYAFNHQVDLSALDFFNENSTDKMSERIREQMQKDKTEINNPVPAFEMDEELEI